MDLEEIKRGLRAEIKKRENEQYATFQCNVRQMCKDVLAKLEEQESVLAEKDKEIAELEERITDGDKDFEMATSQNERLIKIVRHNKYKLDVGGTSPFDYARSMNVNKMMRAPNRKGSLRKNK